MQPGFQGNSGPSCVFLLVELAEFFGRLHRDSDCVAEEGVERFDPEDLRLEDYAEVARDGFGNGVEVERLPSSFCIEVTGLVVMPQGMIRLK